MTATAIDLTELAQSVRLPLEKTRRALELLDDGNTVAFITRFRKDQTGGLDEQQIRSIQRAAYKRRILAERREAICKSIQSQGKLTEPLARQIEAADSPKTLEDLYLPYRPKKQTLATIARQRGLEPLAREILEALPPARELDTRAADFVDPDRDLHSVAEVLLGVGHLLAERLAERADLRATLRHLLHSTGQLVSTRVEPSPRSNRADTQAAREVALSDGAGGDASGGNHAAPQQGSSPESAGDERPVTPPAAGRGPSAPGAAAGGKKAGAEARLRRKRQRQEKAFQDYFDFREALTGIPHHRVLAINRGERAKVLRVRVEGDEAELHRAACALLVPDDHPHGQFVRECLRDALTRLVLPGLERELRRELTEKAEEHAVGVFARNLRKLLLQPPVRGRRVLAIDPAFRSGCNVAALDAFGQLLQHDVIYVVGKGTSLQEGRAKLVYLIREHEASVVAIGNGTACRETEQLVADMINHELQDREVAYVVVNEAGTSAYSTSPLGREELPHVDPGVRSTISIGRRLLDPLSELVKIDAANLGVGLYQHDIKAKHLRDSLDAVVASCVNFVGVDVNTASPALLSYVSGLNQLTARRLYEYRLEHGPFRRREQIREVPGIGEATWVQAAGFLKITDGDNSLDATWIHPESYDVARRLLARLDSSVAETADGFTGREARAPESASLAERTAGIDLPALARELDVGEWLLQDLLAALTRPGRDPRDDLSPPMFRTGILKLDDLKPGMELAGTVLNVVDFGAFVDIGVSDSALIHISRLNDRYVRDPHEVVSIGDTLRVWVVDVDKQRRRVALSAIPPGTRRKLGGQEAQPPTQKQAAAEQRPQKPRKRQAAHQRPAKPRTLQSRKRTPARPISQAMVEGKEPMRSFSDLLQFYQRQQPDDDDARRG